MPFLLFYWLCVAAGVEKVYQISLGCRQYETSALSSCFNMTQLQHPDIFYNWQCFDILTWYQHSELLFFYCLCYISEVCLCLFCLSETPSSFHLQNSHFEESLFQRSLLLNTEHTSPHHRLSSRDRVSRSLFRKSSHGICVWCTNTCTVLYAGVYALYKCVLAKFSSLSAS